MVATAEGERVFDGTWEHQSTSGLVMQLLVEIKSQGVWSRDEAWAALMNPDNIGGAWLRRQAEPSVTFDDMWERAYQHPPRLSVEQATELVVRMIEDQPGIQLVYLREAVGGNRGRLDGLLAGLVENGTLREERTYGPGGGCTSRRFWKIASGTPVVIASVVATTVSLALLAATTHLAKGHRTTEGEGLSFLVLLTSKRLRAAGLRRWRRMAALARQRGRPPEPPPPRDPCLDIELFQLIEGLDP